MTFKKVFFSFWNFYGKLWPSRKNQWRGIRRKIGSEFEIRSPGEPHSWLHLPALNPLFEFLKKISSQVSWITFFPKIRTKVIELNLIVKRRLIHAIAEMKFRSFVLCDIVKHFAPDQFKKSEEEILLFIHFDLFIQMFLCSKQDVNRFMRESVIKGISYCVSRDSRVSGCRWRCWSFA